MKRVRRAFYVQGWSVKRIVQDCTISLKAGPLSQWLHFGPTNAEPDVALMETRQVKGTQKAMPIKTDCLPERKPSRSSRDAIPMMPRSGLLPVQVKHPNEKGTSELQ